MLYSPVIRERFRHPRFFGELDAPEAVFEDVNPLCGDRVRIQLKLVNGSIQDARFKGDSCAICMASADLLVEMAQGRAISEVLALGPDDLLGRLEAKIRPSRMTCVTLPLQVMKGALTGVGATRTSEGGSAPLPTPPPQGCAGRARARKNVGQVI